MSVFVKIKDFILEIIELFLEVMAEIVLPFIKKEIVFIFKEHPIVTVLIVFTSIVVSTTIGLASPRHTVKEDAQSIVIAETKEAPTYKKVEMEHEICSGETLLGLACKYSRVGESPNEWISNVKQMNSIKNENWIKTGTKIKIYTWEVQ